VSTRSYRRFGGLQYLHLVELTDNEDEDITNLRNPICMDWPSGRPESTDAWLLYQADKHEKSRSKAYCQGHFWHSVPIECDAVSTGDLSTFRQIVAFSFSGQPFLDCLTLTMKALAVFRNVGIYHWIRSHNQKYQNF